MMKLIGEKEFELISYDLVATPATPYLNESYQTRNRLDQILCWYLNVKYGLESNAVNQLHSSTKDRGPG